MSDRPDLKQDDELEEVNDLDTRFRFSEPHRRVCAAPGCQWDAWKHGDLCLPHARASHEGRYPEASQPRRWLVGGLVLLALSALLSVLLFVLALCGAASESSL